MKKKRRDSDTMSLSFLDSISCGFGAVILLLVLSKIFEPIRLEESREQQQGVIARYEQELHDILGETEVVQRERQTTKTQVDNDQEQISALQRDLVKIRSQLSQQESDAEISSELAGRLAHVFVDEYQDLNPAQEGLLQGLHALGARITVVGDDDQAIYQWRGGDVDLFRSFTERQGFSWRICQRTAVEKIDLSVRM